LFLISLLFGSFAAFKIHTASNQSQDEFFG